MSKYKPNERKTGLAHIDTQVEELNKKYDTHYKNLFTMKKNMTISVTINNKKTLTSETLSLGTEINAMLKQSEAIVKKNNFHNHACLLHIKITILNGYYDSVTGKSDTAITHYNNAIESLETYQRFLQYEEDVFFQKEIKHAFTELNTCIQFQRGKPHSLLMEKRFKSIQDKTQSITSTLFKNKCNSTIVGLESKFGDFSLLYADGYANNLTLEALNTKYADHKKDFFALADTLQQSHQAKQSSNMLSKAEKINQLHVNLMMLNMFEITDSDTVWRIKKINGIAGFDKANALPFPKLIDYLKRWQALKMLYIKPSIDSIQNLCAEEAKIDIILDENYSTRLDKWLSYLHMPANFFETTAIAMAENLTKPSRELSKELDIHGDFYKETIEFIINLLSEVEYLLSAIAIIEEAAKKQQHTFKKEILEHSQIIVAQHSQMQKAIAVLMRQDKLVKFQAILAQTIPLLVNDNNTYYETIKLHLEEPKPSCPHNEVFKALNFMFLGHFVLINLLENYAKEQQSEFLAIPELIEMSQTAYKNIDAVISLVNKNYASIIDSLGKHLANEKLLNPSTSEEIKQLGLKAFESIVKDKGPHELKALAALLYSSQFTVSGLTYLQDRIQPFICKNYERYDNEIIGNDFLKIRFFSRHKQFGRSATLSPGRFAGLVGLASVLKYEDTNEITYLHVAYCHFQNAYAHFKNADNNDAMEEVARRIDAIAEQLNIQAPTNTPSF